MKRILKIELSSFEDMSNEDVFITKSTAGN
jgi:hypothetical protein